MTLTYADLLKATKKRPPSRIGIPKPLNVGEEMFTQQLKAHGIPFEREYRFAPPRRWKFDFLLPSSIACEIEGGVYSGGRHVRGKGYEEDLIKYNQATSLGYKVMRYTPAQIKTGQPILEICKLLSTLSASSLQDFNTLTVRKAEILQP